MDLHLEGKCVLITGGSKGIGLACAQSFAAEGCDVHIVGRSLPSLERAREHVHQELNRPVTVHCADVGDPQQRLTLAPIMEHVDILINNAGAIPGGSLDDIDMDRWKQAWEVKVYGYIEMTRMALAAMTRRQSGVIVNVIGSGGASPRYEYVCGSAANSALMTFTKAVGAHAARIGVDQDSRSGTQSGDSAGAGGPATRSGRVRVLGVNPGPTSTDRLLSVYRARAQALLGDGDRWPELLADLPFGRPSEAAEIADIVTFMASDRASYLTGVVLDADGGAMYR